MHDENILIINSALHMAGLEGFTGNYVHLGGGEVNNAYKIDFEDRQLVLRIAKDKKQLTLKKEAHALKLLHSPSIPKLVYFNEHEKIDDRLWILESYLPGNIVRRLSLEQFFNLGKLLAQIHGQTAHIANIDLRKQFLSACKEFGDEQFLLNHPDKRLKQLINALWQELGTLQPDYNQITVSLIHLDITPSNILVNSDQVGLIDWEFSINSDPMRDFSTIYYEDIEYNHGKWRIKIKADEKEQLFKGYEANGGKINEDSIRFWIRFDKVSAAVFLYWRVHQSTRPTSPAETEQYKLDYKNILTSLTN